MLSAVAVAAIGSSAFAGSSYSHSSNHKSYGKNDHQQSFSFGKDKYGKQDNHFKFDYDKKDNKKNSKSFNFNDDDCDPQPKYNWNFDFGKSHKTKRFDRDCDLGGWQDKLCKFDDWKKSNKCEPPKLPWDCDVPPQCDTPRNDCEPEPECTVVPVPAAAWTGMAMLGGLALVRKLRRRNGSEPA